MAPNSKLGEDFKIQQEETHFFDLFELHYQPGEGAIDFYERYRSLIIANLKKRGDIIMWQNSTILETDEELSPTFEDMILANVLGLIDAGLPGCVKENYQHLIGRTKSLMDYRNDILIQVPSFLTKMEEILPDKYSIDMEVASR